MSFIGSTPARQVSVAPFNSDRAVRSPLKDRVELIQAPSSELLSLRVTPLTLSGGKDATGDPPITPIVPLHRELLHAKVPPPLS